MKRDTYSDAVKNSLRAEDLIRDGRAITNAEYVELINSRAAILRAGAETQAAETRVSKETRETRQRGYESQKLKIDAENAPKPKSPYAGIIEELQDSNKWLHLSTAARKEKLKIYKGMEKEHIAAEEARLAAEERRLTIDADPLVISMRQCFATLENSKHLLPEEQKKVGELRALAEAGDARAYFDVAMPFTQNISNRVNAACDARLAECAKRRAELEQESKTAATEFANIQPKGETA